MGLVQEYVYALSQMENLRNQITSSEKFKAFVNQVEFAVFEAFSLDCDPSVAEAEEYKENLELATRKDTHFLILAYEGAYTFDSVVECFREGL